MNILFILKFDLTQDQGRTWSSSFTVQVFYKQTSLLANPPDCCCPSTFLAYFILILPTLLFLLCHYILLFSCFQTTPSVKEKAFIVNNIFCASGSLWSSNWTASLQQWKKRLLSSKLLIHILNWNWLIFNSFISTV